MPSPAVWQYMGDAEMVDFSHKNNEVLTLTSSGLVSKIDMERRQVLHLIL